MLEIAIVGTGPYGLSVAAHFRKLGISYRIFGRPMDSWLSHMPKGMLLKSDGFASNLSDPGHEFTLGKFCQEEGIEYAEMGTPVSLETFAAYGLAFRNRMVRDVEEKMVTNITRTQHNFLLRLDDGETVSARRVLLAVGITHFAYLPSNLMHLPSEILTHSFQHSNLDSFKGRSVVVLGAGSSAMDLAGLLRQTGADVQLVARRKVLTFHEKMPMDKPRSLWQNIRRPLSGLGPGLKSRFCANHPELFHYLPESIRLSTVRTHLGPSGGWFAKDLVLGKLPLHLGCALDRTEMREGKVHLHLRTDDGAERTITAEHIIAATGYRVDMERLTFLSSDIRSKIDLSANCPELSPSFESSVPGLHFVGLAAANSFGPLMRFAFGADFAARQLAHHLPKVLCRERAMSQVPSLEGVEHERNQVF